MFSWLGLKPQGTSSAGFQLSCFADLKIWGIFGWLEGQKAQGASSPGVKLGNPGVKPQLDYHSEEVTFLQVV